MRFYSAMAILEPQKYVIARTVGTENVNCNVSFLAIFCTILGFLIDKCRGSRLKRC